MRYWQLWYSISKMLRRAENSFRPLTTNHYRTAYYTLRNTNAMDACFYEIQILY
jgi:hypothetical protein